MNWFKKIFLSFKIKVFINSGKPKTAKEINDEFAEEFRRRLYRDAAAAHENKLRIVKQNGESKNATGKYL